MLLFLYKLAQNILENLIVNFVHRFTTDKNHKDLKRLESYIQKNLMTGYLVINNQTFDIYDKDQIIVIHNHPKNMLINDQ